MLNYQLHALKNGLRIITAPMHETKAVAVLFLVGVGSRHEPKKQSGLAHFFEHMVFKGTARRPSTLHISTELDSIGAQYNAYTAEEYTGFYVRASAGQFPLAFDILTDMLWQATFNDQEIEREKGVIVEEINMYRDNPQSHVGELAKKILFGDTPLGRQIAGAKESVMGLKRPDFLRHRANFYTPGNVVVVVAGNPSHYDWQKAIAQSLADDKKHVAPDYQPFDDHQSGPRLAIEYRSTDQAHLVLTIPKFPRTDRRWPSIRVLNNLLGNMMSSRLFIEVRERRGLAYYIGSGFDDYRDSGLFYVRAGVDIAKIDQAIQVILKELGRLTIQLIPEDELIKAKENLKGNIYLSLEDSLSVAEFLADQALFWPTIDQPEEIVDRIMKVTTNDIMRLAKELFVAKKLNLAVIGPYKDEDRFRKLLKI